MLIKISVIFATNILRNRNIYSLPANFHGWCGAIGWKFGMLVGWCRMIEEYSLMLGWLWSWEQQEKELDKDILCCYLVYLEEQEQVNIRQEIYHSGGRMQYRYPSVFWINGQIWSDAVCMKDQFKRGYLAGFLE